MQAADLMYSESHYIRILKALVDNGYRTLSFSEESDQRSVYLRHDIDWSMEYALKFAELDARFGVRSTFAFLIRGASYNLLEAKSKNIVQQIQNLGHFIALHYPAPSEIGDASRLQEDISRDYSLLEREFGKCDRAFAWHNTNSSIMAITHNFEVSGLINIYNEKFLRNMEYRSDSNMRNSIQSILDIIESKQSKLHLLLHPYLWLSRGNTITEKMLDVIGHRWLAIDQLGLENRDYKAAFPNGIGSDLLSELFRKALSRALPRNFETSHERN